MIPLFMTIGDYCNDCDYWWSLRYPTFQKLQNSNIVDVIMLTVCQDKTVCVCVCSFVNAIRFLHL